MPEPIDISSPARTGISPTAATREHFYIDLNIVRAGVVVHPQEWPYSGYNEIQKPRERYGLIDHDKLMDLAGLQSRQDLEQLHKAWIDEGLAKGNPFRED